MKILNPHHDPSLFFQELVRAPTRILFLDYDGTLAPFTPDRDRAFPYPGVPPLLERLIALPSNRIVLISGRHIDGIKPLLKLKNLPEIWGSHGLERLLADGTYQTAPLPEELLQTIDDAANCVTIMGLGEQIERKPAGLALHTRGLGNREARDIISNVMSKWQPLAQRAGLSIHPFDGGVELRVPGIDKGHAVRTVLAEAPERTIAAYLGDDLTDEDAFLAMKGKGAAVLVRREFRETEADLWIEPPEELLQFLKQWLELCGG
jgi:trehalose 6-phosphate phosphatase